MDPVEAAQVEQRPVRMLDGHFGRIATVDQSAGHFGIEVWDRALPLGTRLVPFDRVERLRPGCDALIQIAAPTA